LKTVPGCRRNKTLSSVAVVGRMVSSIRRRFGAAARSPGRRDTRFAQAALDSIWCTLAGTAPLMAIRRGFMASGISRTSSIFSRPLSKDACGASSQD
jgi:hypothetical protein